MFIRTVFLLAVTDLFGGFIFGLTYTVIVHQVQSISQTGKKGVLVSTIHLALMLGILFGQTAYDFDRHTAIRNFGVFTFFLANIGVVFNFFFSREVVERPRDDMHAMEPMPNFQGNQAAHGGNDLPNSQTISVIFHCLLKLAYILTFNITLNSTSLFNSETSFSKRDHVPIVQHSIACLSQLYRYRNGSIFIAFRILGIILACLTVDLRRRINLVAQVFSGICLMVLAVFDLVTHRYTKLIQSVLQLLCGFSVGFLSDVFATESLKLPGIIMVNVLEFSLQTIFFIPFAFDLLNSSSSIAGFRTFSGLTLFIVSIAISVMVSRLMPLYPRKNN